MKLKELQMIEGVEPHGSDLYLYAVVVAEAYEAAPSTHPIAAKAYKVLDQSNRMLFKRLKSDIDVEFTPDDPYGGHSDVVNAITKDKKLKVFSGGKDTANWDLLSRSTRAGVGK